MFAKKVPDRDMRGTVEKTITRLRSRGDSRETRSTWPRKEGKKLREKSPEPEFGSVIALKSSTRMAEEKKTRGEEERDRHLRREVGRPTEKDRPDETLGVAKHTSRRNVMRKPEGGSKSLEPREHHEERGSIGEKVTDDFKKTATQTKVRGQIHLKKKTRGGGIESSSTYAIKRGGARRSRRVG